MMNKRETSPRLDAYAFRCVDPLSAGWVTSQNNVKNPRKIYGRFLFMSQVSRKFFLEGGQDLGWEVEKFSGGDRETALICGFSCV